MKVAVLVVGIIVLVVGAIGVLWGFLVANSAETTYAFFCPSGSMPAEFCANLLRTASTYRTVALVSAAIAVGGLAITVAGAAMKGPAPPPAMMPMPQPVPPPVSGAIRTCGRCGRANPWNDRFCANCGAPLA